MPSWYPPARAGCCNTRPHPLVLACAPAAGADLIVSGDEDLLVLKKYQGIPILAARQALEQFAD